MLSKGGAPAARAFTTGRIRLRAQHELRRPCGQDIPARAPRLVDEKRVCQAPRGEGGTQQRLLRLKPWKVFGNQLNIAGM
jgi:hypothetical protein